MVRFRSDVVPYGPMRSNVDPIWSDAITGHGRNYLAHQQPARCHARLIIIIINNDVIATLESTAFKVAVTAKSCGKVKVSHTAVVV